DLDSQGTLGYASTALEAEIEHAVDFVIAETGLAEPAGHRQPQNVGAAPRRMFFLARRHVGRAHRSVERLAAHAEAAAHFDRAAHAAVPGIVEVGRWVRGLVACAVPKIRREGLCVDNLAGVEDALR